jgi:hypothetical protein
MSIRRALTPGPFSADQIRPGDPYELSNGHAILSPPTGQRGGKANLVGGAVLETDPEVRSAGVDVGVSPRPKDLRAPDIAVGNVEDEPGWARTAPPLAVEYADVGQDEDSLASKILELFENGTRVLWVVRLAGERRVEIHEPGKRMRIARPGEQLLAPGILANPVPVEALWDRDAAHEVTLRNLLNRKGYRDLDDVRLRGREEGREEGVVAMRRTLEDVLAARGLVPDEAARARIARQEDLGTLTRWISAAAIAKDVASVFETGRPSV